LSTFLDFGNVYQGFDNFDAGEFRYSVGISGLWSSPLGPISASLGFPLNSQSQDRKQLFQFTVGTFF
jgi:outer membrane protein insertion porin family